MSCSVYFFISFCNIRFYWLYMYSAFKISTVFHRKALLTYQKLLREMFNCCSSFACSRGIIWFQPYFLFDFYSSTYFSYVHSLRNWKFYITIMYDFFSLFECWQILFFDVFNCLGFVLFVWSVISAFGAFFPDRRGTHTYFFGFICASQIILQNISRIGITSLFIVFSEKIILVRYLSEEINWCIREKIVKDSKLLII